MNSDVQNHKNHRNKLYFLAFAGALGIILTVIGGYQLLHFMDSTDFCGRLCHEVMKPEYTTYQISPHSRVECVDCHVGYKPSYLVRSKINGIPQMFETIFNTYDRPIPVPVENLRPSRDTCENCHWPERFAGDIVRVRRHYLEDENNTEETNTLVLKVGGGRTDTALGIHWHITARVWYLPVDEKRQEIAWVGVEDADGSWNKEFIDPDLKSEIDLNSIEDGKRLMDCIDCHNRATHIFYSPDELINMALAEGRIDRSLPFIKREGMSALDPVNTSLDEAFTKVEAIEEFYKSSYPDIYSEKPNAIAAAISELKHVAELTTFPHMKVSWETNPNNIGHANWPGCLRCHGKLAEIKDDVQGEYIDAGCDSCHYPLPAF